jgi:MinD superfamily P-loop ATPase
MRIAIASGKGGTGKTTVSTNLASIAAASGELVHLIDCDVEEPNCHIFVNPSFEETIKAYSPFPKISEAACTGCGYCASICQYNALVCINKKVMVFPELCHGCGGCWLLCPEQAMTKDMHNIGVIESGTAMGFRFTQGKLNISETKSPTLIHQVKERIQPSEFTIIDSPPGTSCPVIESLRDSDFVILVTEPTPFGLHDLEMAVEMLRKMGLPFGVIINRADSGDQRVVDYCRKEDIDVLLQIPNFREVAEWYSRGELAIHALSSVKNQFQQLFETLQEKAKQYERTYSH